jgi:Ni,Fe-hydrogenase I cytochrome b subunit
MAAMIIAGIAMFSIIKGASSAKGKLPVADLLVFNLCFMALFMCCAGLVFWLTLTEEVSEWFSVLNSFVVVLSLLFSYGVSAAMNFVVKHPEQVVTKS